MNERTPVHGDLLDEQMQLTLEELCQVCKADEHLVVEMVREGVVEAWTSETDQWVFSGVAVTRVRTAIRLQQDLDVNLPGAALALELIDEIERLRSRRR